MIETTIPDITIKRIRNHSKQKNLRIFFNNGMRGYLNFMRIFLNFPFLLSLSKFSNNKNIIKLSLHFLPGYNSVQFFFQDLSSLTVSLLSFQARLQRGPMLSRHSPWETHPELLFHPSRTSLLGPSGCPSLLLFPTALLDWNISRRYLHPSSFPGEWVVT